MHFSMAANESRPGVPTQLRLSSMGTQRSMALALNTFQPFPSIHRGFIHFEMLFIDLTFQLRSGLRTGISL